jgi:hypothetical protein
VPFLDPQRRPAGHGRGRCGGTSEHRGSQPKGGAAKKAGKGRARDRWGRGAFTPHLAEHQLVEEGGGAVLLEPLLQEVELAGKAPAEEQLLGAGCGGEEGSGGLGLEWSRGFWARGRGGSRGLGRRGWKGLGPPPWMGLDWTGLEWTGLRGRLGDSQAAAHPSARAPPARQRARPCARGPTPAEKTRPPGRPRAARGPHRAWPARRRRCGRRCGARR